ncbi:EAL domain-containing protein [Deinococcus arenicola]|uniref:EAL domain-containing protein n=1 Tax=Deinococcus arenicola TaxID=2994950 RepID=A0ABU4DQ54_9DEIO|nr:EAL domain-containing protein [Deinococcus sp. ZS9-10]MDV6374558.1 EAL domain-containing protein [Deinococcus sp. ZS9-10]
MCDCQSLQPGHNSGLEGLALYAASSHLRRKLHLLLEAHHLAFELHGPAFVVAADSFTALNVLVDSFSMTERHELMSTPCQGSQPDPWQTAPLVQWLHRLNTPWFVGAAQHLHFEIQPIVGLGTMQVYGHEALVRARWNGQHLGAPALLNAAAAHGQARAFDAQARRNAITQVYPMLPPQQRLFVNFSPSVVYNPEICLQTTFEACREVGADLSRLVFEVTESEAFPDLKMLRRILQRYRAEGAQVALDDLGAGHTSLLYLAELQPDVVKLDQALIRGLHADDARLPLVEALISYAHALGIQVVAEGIETADELALVMELGSDYGQGYYLGRPAANPVADLPISRPMGQGRN